MKTSPDERKRDALYFKAHLPALLVEIATNPECAALVSPLGIIQDLLGKLAQRAAEINDPRLNLCCADLTLFGEVDPYDKESYDPKAYGRIKKAARAAIAKATGQTE